MSGAPDVVTADQKLSFAASLMPWIDEQSDQAGDALQVRRRRRAELGRQVLTRQTGRQFARREVGRDERERIMVRGLARRRARPRIMADAHQALAADILVGILA